MKNYQVCYTVAGWAKREVVLELPSEASELDVVNRIVAMEFPEVELAFCFRSSVTANQMRQKFAIGNITVCLQE